MKKTITIIDDNESLVTSLSLQLNLSNYNVNKFICPEKAIEYLTTNPSDGYIVDFKMPKMNGIEFYKDLCSILGKDKLPAIFLTGVEQIEERVLRHTTAGDFVKKPFSYSILIARLEKVMSYFATQNLKKVIKLGNLSIYPEQLLIKWYNKEIEMTKSEFNLVYSLAKHPFVVNTRDKLLDTCYGEDMIMTDRNIDSHIKRIRKKFRKANPKINFDRIKTHYGNGYSWNPKSITQ